MTVFRYIRRKIRVFSLSSTGSIIKENTVEKAKKKEQEMSASYLAAQTDTSGKNILKSLIIGTMSNFRVFCQKITYLHRVYGKNECYLSD